MSEINVWNQILPIVLSVLALGVSIFAAVTARRALKESRRSGIRARQDARVVEIGDACEELRALNESINHVVQQSDMDAVRDQADRLQTVTHKITRRKESIVDQALQGSLGELEDLIMTKMRSTDNTTGGIVPLMRHFADEVVPQFEAAEQIPRDEPNRDDRFYHARATRDHARERIREKYTPFEKVIAKIETRVLVLEREGLGDFGKPPRPKIIGRGSAS